MKVIVTGSSGFIGHHVCKLFLESGIDVVGVDLYTDNGDLKLKKARDTELKLFDSEAKLFQLNIDIRDKNFADQFPKNSLEGVEAIVHLAALSGVRDSIDRPYEVYETNVIGFLNVLMMAATNSTINKFVYASTGAVYGDCNDPPFKEIDNTDYPKSVYAASKKSNEALAEVVADAYSLVCTGLRFFTVYGRYGRPDMSLMKMAKSIFSGEPIHLYNRGNHIRDFIHVTDVVDGVMRSLNREKGEFGYHRIYNIGTGVPVKLVDYLDCLIRCSRVSKKEIQIFNLPKQRGDPVRSFTDNFRAKDELGFHYSIELEEGIADFMDWYSSCEKLPHR